MVSTATQGATTSENVASLSSQDSPMDDPVFLHHAESPTVQAWIRCDNMVGTWLTNSLLTKLQTSIIYEDTTLEIWADLRNRFAQSNGPRIYNLQKEIADLHQGEVSRLSDLQVRESVLKFLMGLNESFSQVRSQVLLMDSLPFVNKVYALLIQEAMQRSVPHQSGVKVDSTALVAKMQTFNAGITSGGNGVKGKDKPICTHCGKIGHIADKCY
ncbi:uncharacterized protein LOC142620755 [Castanea sativa]|uniref:uncharacterized protein LOC142620755 n=1 Tax=Castanea sativa TaxID=21020 RepID=UPI003F65297D